MSLKDAILRGDVRATARAASLIEAGTRAGLALSRELFAHTGNALTVGVTGGPGVGKSTLVNSLIGALRASGKKVGVIAVDPSSPYSRGALLGDRVRMLEHHDDAGVFIRSMATRGRLGGVAGTTLDLMLLLDAAGWPVILIETVGVGQEEMDITDIAEVTVLVLAPGAGDEIQAMKAGLLEAADVVVINKADLAGADRLEQEILESQRLGDDRGASVAAVCRTSAINNDGVAELLTRLEEAAQRVRRRKCGADIWARRLRQSLRDDLLSDVTDEMLMRSARSVSARIEDPHSAVVALRRELMSARTNGH